MIIPDKIGIKICETCRHHAKGYCLPIMFEFNFYTLKIDCYNREVKAHCWWKNETFIHNEKD